MQRKYHVGRPSIKELKRRRINKIIFLSLPIFIIVAVIFIVKNGNFSHLMGNSVNNYYCLDDAKYINNKCVKEIKKPVYLIGDIDRNNKIDIQDATMLQVYMNKIYLLDSQQTMLADCNGDGEINSDDVTSIQQFLANKEPRQTIESNVYSLVNRKKVCGISYELRNNECVRNVSNEPLIKSKYKDVKYAYYLGDINKDEIVDGNDYLILKNYISKKNDYSLDEEQLVIADLNMDLKIDNEDLNCLIKYLIDKKDENIGKKRLCLNGYELNNSYCVIEEKEVLPTNIILDKNEEQLTIGNTSKINVTLEPNNVTNKEITYKSSNDNIATVSKSGVVTAKAIGKANITVSTNNLKAIYKLTVISEKDSFCNSLIKSGAKSLDYMDFKKKFPNEDDFYAIKLTHDCANKYNLDVKVSKGTYHIYKKNLESINVKTNTDLGGSNIYIHDETGAILKTEIVEKNGNKSIKNVRNYPIYKIKNEKSYNLNKLSNVSYNNIIPELVGKEYSLVIIENNKKQVFKRSGNNEKKDSNGNTLGDNAKDAFRVDKNGKVLDNLFWNYDNISSITVYPISNQNLKFENGNFYTIVDTKDFSNVNEYTKRGLLVERSNTTINNIKHAYVSKKVAGVYEPVQDSTYPYNGFYRFNNAADITFTNSIVYSINGMKNNNLKSIYDLLMNDVVNAKIENVKMYDYQDTENYFNSNNQLNNDSWGVTGTNRCKNITFNNCVLNRIDAHRGIYNLNINNSIIGKYGINVVGFGSLNIENTKIMYTNDAIVLRKDYGSFWKGKITIKNSEIIPANNEQVFLIYFKITYDENGKNKGYVHDYGYDLFLPDVNIDNLKISSNANKFSIFKNNNYSTNNTNLKISVNGRISDIKNKYIKKNSFNYHYPTSDKIKYKNITGNNKSLNVNRYYKKISN